MDIFTCLDCNENEVDVTELRCWSCQLDLDFAGVLDSELFLTLDWTE
jgi:hypothetical protein